MSFVASNLPYQLVPLPPDSKDAATPLFLVACGSLDCRSKLLRSPTFPLLHNYVTDERPSISTYTARDKRLKLVLGPRKLDPKFSDMSILSIPDICLMSFSSSFRSSSYPTTPLVHPKILVCSLVFGVLSTLSAQLYTARSKASITG